jgi:RNA polymerase sigma-70 factor (ECF subfamily)
MTVALINPALDLAGVLSLSLGRRALAPKAKGRARVRAQSEDSTAGKARAEDLAEELAGWLDAVARNQDRDAFAHLHRHFAPKLAAWMARAGMAQAQIEDIVQDCMVAVWRKASLYDRAHGGVSTWIFTIARNLRVDHSRRKANRAMLPLNDWDETDDAPGGESRLLAAESEAQVRRALEQLPQEQKQVLIEAYFADKSQTAIAQELGLPLGTVKSRLRLALAKLRALLEDAR